MIFSKQRMNYGGDDPDGIIEGYCIKCKTTHSLPAKDWVVELRGKGKIRLLCRDSATYIRR